MTDLKYFKCNEMDLTFTFYGNKSPSEATVRKQIADERFDNIKAIQEYVFEHNKIHILHRNKGVNTMYELRFSDEQISELLEGRHEVFDGVRFSNISTHYSNSCTLRPIRFDFYSELYDENDMVVQRPPVAQLEYVLGYTGDLGILGPESGVSTMPYVIRDATGRELNIGDVFLLARDAFFVYGKLESVNLSGWLNYSDIFSRSKSVIKSQAYDIKNGRQCSGLLKLDSELSDEVMMAKLRGGLDVNG